MSTWPEQYLLRGDKEADGRRRGSPGNGKARLADQAQGLLGRAARAAGQAARGQGHQAVHALSLCRDKGPYLCWLSSLIRPGLEDGIESHDCTKGPLHRLLAWQACRGRGTCACLWAQSRRDHLRVVLQEMSRQSST